MGIDPLFEPEDNSDLVNRANKKKTEYQLRASGGDDIPEELKKALQDYLDTRQEEAKTSTPIMYRAVSSSIDYLAQRHGFQKSGAGLLAMADVLDQMTDGVLSELTVYYEARRQIIVYKDVVIGLKRLLKILETPQLVSEYQEAEHIYVLFDIYLDYCNYQLDQAVATYRASCASLDREVDELLIETGYPSERTAWDRQIFGSPIAWKETD